MRGGSALLHDEDEPEVESLSSPTPGARETTSRLPVTVGLSADHTTIVILAAGGRLLEVPVVAWPDVVRRVDVLVAGRQPSGSAAAAALGSTAFGPAPGKVGPGRHGADWSAHEAGLLADGFSRGDTVAALALAHQRTTGAVEHQLVKLGLLRPSERQFGAPRRTAGQT